MVTLLNRFEAQRYALLRIVAGFLFMFHGLQKLGFLAREAVDFGTLSWAAGTIEVIGGPLIMLGLFTVQTAFLCSGQMAVAYFLRHQPEGLWPIQNRGELAALYCFLFLYVAARGAGIWSVDALTRNQRRALPDLDRVTASS
jgi:putative oxidoreductase